MPDPSARSEATRRSSRSEKGSREERATEGDIDPETKSHPKEPFREVENERKRNMTKKSTCVEASRSKKRRELRTGVSSLKTVGNQRRGRGAIKTRRPMRKLGEFW
jgi:hypothetical protein